MNHVGKRAVTTANEPKSASNGVSAAAALSFLKQTRGMLSWTPKDLQTSLLATPPEAREVLGLLELQGYVKKSHEKSEEWLTTLNGEAVSGSKPPRFSRESVEKALASLRERIEQANQGRQAPYIVAQAVAFGDFQMGAAQAQAADVGIQLVARTSQASPRGAKGAAEFLRDLRAKDLKVNLVHYQPWMSARAHLNLLVSQRAEIAANLLKLKSRRKTR